ncbi:hypothetical protein OT_ostta02g02065 [Ostreococcus tauri]|uniref:Uncharacterized protein n=1 Tax=Ostreococcus tauri TaxID=70448 RepID=A0A090MBQ4_OSTTA|nr:hypothetical protein OT_ostta02g02065 [Ostreococcus tauri]CEG01014.1 hypothetical protein OT_ostta02g02065 [Ostreococcus tauri]|eukprot:XP_022840742.1 hypothetical protein OT_ostta02g02065 [Ostreococcus tauri]
MQHTEPFAMQKPKARCQLVDRKPIVALSLLTLLFCRAVKARQYSEHRFCGSYVRVEQQNAKDVVQRCYGRMVLAQEPEYKYQIVNNPDLTAAGRQKPFVALDFKNSASAADITVVTSVYNAAPALEKSLPQLFLKTTGSWEFVLVLDACYDASYSTAVKLLQSYFRTQCSFGTPVHTSRGLSLPTASPTDTPTRHSALPLCPVPC